MWVVILSAVILPLAVLAGFFVSTARRIGRPTRGVWISSEANRRALVVIDMQEDFTRATGATAYEEDDRKRAVGRVNELVARARFSGDPVLFVCQEHEGWAVQMVAKFALAGAGNPGRPGACLDRDLDADGFPVFVKHVADAFSVPAFDAFLRREKVGTLVLTGLDLAQCVRGTALGGRNRGYAVIVDLAGVLSANPRASERALREMETAGVSLSKEGEVPHLAA